ncbi:hypothetical protein GOODEAATRI_011641 [Goodea atripinnis]|uniref:Uncharacterized protein n=1 Tax=Goodea atripinnis TaxID=208336 RepID=A0ABV0N9U6_9TELE
MPAYNPLAASSLLNQQYAAALGLGKSAYYPRPHGREGCSNHPSRKTQAEEGYECFPGQTVDQEEAPEDQEGEFPASKGAWGHQ